MTRFFLALFLTATPALAQDANRALVIAMTNAIEDAGCVITAENGDAILADAGLTEEQTYAVIAQMYTDGTLTLQPDGTGKLVNEDCP